MVGRRLVIYGAGGFAREVAWLAAEARPDGGAWQLVGFIDDHGRQTGQLKGLPVRSLAESRAAWPNAAVVVAVGSPQTREALTMRARAAGFESATLIHRRAEMSDSVEVGAGSVICAGSILTVDVRLGSGVQINLDCTVGHDSVLEDYATLAPGVHVSGWVKIGKGAYLGTGATVVNGRDGEPLVIGPGAVVGAGACVVGDVPPGVTVVGVPARPIGSRS